MDLRIGGRTALVTGGGNGIGAAISAALCREGVHVAVVDIDREAAEAHAETLRASGGTAVAFAADVSSAPSVDELHRRVHASLGGIGILVNNAGFTRDRRIVHMSEADWDAVIDVVLKGAFLCVKAFLPGMIEVKWGRIVNISSRAHLGNPGQANYSAAKAGLLGFTRALAMENGQHGVTVNAVAPGIIDTSAVRALPHYEKIVNAAQKNTPVPRIGRVEDVAESVLFLASELAEYINGEVLHVTGGRY